MTMITDVISYENGNCTVTLDMCDGTKTRSCEGTPNPEFPDSIDLKITNWCDAACPYCHEKSTKAGRHADMKSIFNILDGLPRGVEIAIGGGNPWSHPKIAEILLKMKDMGLVANVTMNEFHLNGGDNSSENDINCFSQRRLINGLGISVDDKEPFFEWSRINQGIRDRVVAHVIAGVTSPRYVRLLPDWVKVLVLGYKDVGRGKNFKNVVDVDNRIREWNYWLSAIAQDRVILFDNLAISQLQIKSRLSEDLWNSRYMGDDGQFTMYVDAVENEYAVSSSSERFPLMGQNAKYWFNKIKESRNEN